MALRRDPGQRVWRRTGKPVMAYGIWIGFMRLLPLFSGWLACYALCRELAARGSIHRDWRVSWVLACIWWGMLLTVMVETSSLFHAFNAPVIATAWAG